MLSRSQTGSQNTLIRKPGVSLSFKEIPPSSLYPHEIDTSIAFAVKFTFSTPPGTTTPPEYDTGLHFHVDKAEALRVEKGAIGVQLGAEQMIITPETGEVIIPRWKVHKWWLHSDTDHPEDGETIVWERTLPGSREKEFFFRNLVSYLGDLPRGSPPAFWQLYAFFARWDNFPVINVWMGVGPFAWGIVVYTKVMGLVGNALGMKSTYPDYVPEDALSRCELFFSTILM